MSESPNQPPLQTVAATAVPQQDLPESPLPETPVTRLMTEPPLAPKVPPAAPFAAHNERIEPGFVALVFGVILPLVTFGVEVVTRMCADEFFDPMPTLWHHGLVLSVPLLNVVVWRWLRQGTALTSLPNACWWLNGFVLGVALFYTILYAPLTPLALFALVFLGLGVLPLTPVLSLLATLSLTRRLRNHQRARHRLGFAPLPQLKSVLLGGALGVGSLLLVALPATITRFQLYQAVSVEPVTSAQAVKWLRTYGSESEMVRIAAGHHAQFTDLLGLGANTLFPVEAARAREVYFRVTGRSYDRASSAERAGRLFIAEDNLRMSNLPDDGTHELLPWAPTGLTLAASSLHGVLESTAAVGYLEWTFVVKNSESMQREGRAYLTLPPGGTVSRVTLWVNGEEREAAFAGTGAVTAAYEAVVNQRRDPVLVTSAGLDRVQVRFFPVPPNGEMKFRIGITAPLSRLERESGWLRLPRISERNFAVPAEHPHTIWIEAKQPLMANAKTLIQEQPSSELFAVRGNLTHREWAEGNPAIRLTRQNAPAQVWTTADLPTVEATSVTNGKDKGKPLVPPVKTATIVQDLREQQVNAPQALVVVLDGSVAMQSQSDSLTKALAQLPPQLPFQLIIAGDQVHELTKLQASDSASLAAASAAIQQYARQSGFAGGADNVPALTRAWDVASAHPGGAILWIHGPQPLLLDQGSALAQRWQRRPTAVPVHDLPVTNGPNLVIEALGQFEQFFPVERLDTPATDLARLFSEWQGATKRFALQRSVQLNSAQSTLADAAKTNSKHLARLWAFDEVKRLNTQAKQTPDKQAESAAALTKQAIELAIAYQLVTPVSGAVVLETKEQYERAGLKPVARDSVPTIPEPETWLMLFMLSGLLCWLVWQQMRARKLG